MNTQWRHPFGVGKDMGPQGICIRRAGYPRGAVHHEALDLLFRCSIVYTYDSEDLC